MNVALVYVYPQVQRPVYDPLAARFIRSLRRFPPDYPFSLHVVGNGAPVSEFGRNLFLGVPTRFLAHTNAGKDIGAFQLAAEKIPCDLLVCLGAHVQAHRDGWLNRIVDVVYQFGPHLYGNTGWKAPTPHIRTTAFWVAPDLLNAYPDRVLNPSRYAFEHGPASLTQFVFKSGFNCYMATFTGVYGPKDWDRPDAHDYLFWDQWTDRAGVK